MKVLWLLTTDRDATAAALAAAHALEHDVETIDLRAARDWGRVVDAIAAADRVISW
jgi:hypothetical protein